MLGVREGTRGGHEIDPQALPPTMADLTTQCPPPSAHYQCPLHNTHHPVPSN